MAIMMQKTVLRSLRSKLHPPVQVGVSGLKGPRNLGTKREEVLRGWQENERVWSGTRVPLEREWQRSAGAE